MNNQQSIDERFMRAYAQLTDIYNGVAKEMQNRELQFPRSFRVCGFLTRRALMFADAAMILADKGLLVPAHALLRTCIESQARAYSIVSYPVDQREVKAEELLKLIELGRAKSFETILETVEGRRGDLGEALAIVQNLRKAEPEARMREIIDRVKAESPSESIHRRAKNLRDRWTYGTLRMQRRQFGKNAPYLRIMEMQPTFDLYYEQSCSAVHSDPSSTVFEEVTNTAHIVQYAVASTLSAVSCLLIVMGRDNDDGLREVLAIFESLRK